MIRKQVRRIFLLLVMTGGVLSLAALPVLSFNTSVLQQKQADYSANEVPDTVSYDTVMSKYRNLYEDIETRQADSLWKWLDHSRPLVRQQAWRGMVHARVSDPYRLEIEAEETDEAVAWFALGHHELNKDLRRILEKRWEEDNHLRKGISRVLGMQGDQQSLNFLLSRIDQVRGSQHEFAAALAIGRLSRKYTPSNSKQFKLIQSAFTASDPHIGRAYLYGAYRSDTTLFNPEITQNLYKLWQVYGVGRSPKMDQYLVKILGRSYPQATLEKFQTMSVDSISAQLGIELAALIQRAPLDTVGRRITEKLMHHANPGVVSHAVEVIGDMDEPGDPLVRTVTDSLLRVETLPDKLWAEVFRTSLQLENGPDSVDSHLNRLDQLRRRNPYITPIYLDIQQGRSLTRYYTAIDSLLRANQTPSNTFAARSLVSHWEPGSKKAQKSARTDSVRALLFRALESGDRGAAYAITSLIEDSSLVKTNDYERIEESLQAFRLPGDIEVYQAMGQSLHDRFPERAAPLIDSLASYGYAPLNKSLRSAGWSIENESDSASADFRRPNWQRLVQLGPDPIWTLRTDHDTIRIRLDPLRAPMTVSAIDSLTRAGAYDSVAFHRVVPNFVIQGGDIERGDGFGGPSFTLLTEPSELHYTRGSVGIASAGTDTEGSQYFIMHQWKPHLNGSYTRYGTVIEGMEAVDRIMQGDRVLEASIRGADEGGESDGSVE